MVFHSKKVAYLGSLFLLNQIKHMKLIFAFLLLLSICAGCSNSSLSTREIEYETTEAFDSLVLYQINGFESNRLGRFGNVGNWNIGLSVNEPGVFKIYQYAGRERGSVLFMMTDEKWMKIVDTETKRTSQGSYETSRLFQINALISECDRRHFNFQRKLVEHATVADSTNYYYQLSEENQISCTTELKNIIREDHTSMASLYALNYLDPEVNFTLMDSVICQSTIQYPDLYLRQEIIRNHQLDTSKLSCP